MDIEKKKISKRINIDIDLDLLTLKECKEVFEKLIRKYGEDAMLSLDAGYNSISYSAVTNRFETDKELEERLKAAEARNLKKIEKLENDLKKAKSSLRK